MKNSKIFYIVFFCSFILILFSAICLKHTYAQETKFAPTKRPDVSFQVGDCKSNKAFLDAFAIALQLHLDSIGYIIVYGGQNGKLNEARAIASQMKAYLTQIREIDINRIMTIDGGFREKPYFELWTVGLEAEPPKVTPTVDEKDVMFNGVAEITDSPCSEIKIDDSDVGSIADNQPEQAKSALDLSDVDMTGLPGASQKFLDQDIRTFEDDLAQLDAFAVELQNDRAVNGYVIVYGGKKGEKNQAKARAEFTRAYLVLNRRIPSSKIVVVDGGYREKFHWEMWLVPPGEELPKPTPTVNEKDVKFYGEANVCGYDLCLLYDLGDMDIYDEKAILDSFAVELVNVPTKKGLIKVYGNKQSGRKAYVRRIKSYLTKNRYIPQSRFEVVEGNYRNRQYFSMWFIYESKEPSKSSPVDSQNIGTLTNSSQPRTEKIYDYDSVGYDQDIAALDYFATKLQNDSTANGYFIIYGGKQGRKNEAKQRLICMKNYLIKVRGMEESRLVMIDGGYREKLHAEMWFVPQEAETPKPTPTILPKDAKLKAGIKINNKCDLSF